MRRWFTALLTLLVAAQLSWAGAAVCCVGELGGSTGGTPALVVSEQAHAAAASDAHPVCEAAGHCHCHHAGCATGADTTPSGTAQALAPEAASGSRLQSHIPAGLDRPNWLRA
ncbi:MAG: hypothetical protein JNL93_20655 [Pelomonas sp.]|nr:hypothetical protein [Roseateles sp.]